ncbi:hypothetical protein BKA65DRAFT_248286 [Rhexocercosporidium sp. MPI-PUGE-AT-0058]|nr:hypothetical protein BKA65DRAFT_248286 [Rhexocercosporidium sp. MPI-PUGE-AT-0058]
MASNSTIPTTESSTTSSSIIFSSSSVIPTSSSSIPTTSSTISSTIPTSSSTSTTTSSTVPTSAPTTSTSVTPTVSTITSTNPQGSTITIVTTSTQIPIQNTRTTSSTTSSTSSATTAEPQKSGGSSGKGLSSSGTIAVAVVVPIVAVALLILAGLYFWRKRKARKDAEELRRKEVEEYGYNPNNDPTLPAVGGVGSAGHDGSYEMREDGSSGYRGWGTTAVASSGRKASTTISGGQSAGGIGMAYSEGTSPTHGPVSDTRSENPLVDGRATSPEVEALGAMGPAASANRTGDINRGPSNASSSYSAAARSDGSGDVMSGGGQYYNNQYDTGNPYGTETQYGSPPGRAEMPAQPVIRDVQARRNTRIENPSHFPQQSAGISQNF